MRSFLAMLIAACLAFILTVASAELIALAGYRNSMVNTAMACLWLLIIFGVMRRQARREF